MPEKQIVTVEVVFPKVAFPKNKWNLVAWWCNETEQSSEGFIVKSVMDALDSIAHTLIDEKSELGQELEERLDRI